MRLIFIALLSLLCIACTSTRKPALSSVLIKEIKPRYMQKKAFVRIAEYLNGQEHTGNRMIFRSNPEVRSGYYFTLVLDDKIERLPIGTSLTGEIFTPDSPELKTFTFTLPAQRPETQEIFFGLTGPDWPNPASVANAWQFTIKGPNGEILARSQSYLWAI